jgi:hypothetical protein
MPESSLSIPILSIHNDLFTSRSSECKLSSCHSEFAFEFPLPDERIREETALLVHKSATVAAHVPNDPHAVVPVVKQFKLL